MSRDIAKNIQTVRPPVHDSYSYRWQRWPSSYDRLPGYGARGGLAPRGYGQEELERAGAYLVYEEPADLLRHLDEVGVRSDP